MMKKYSIKKIFSVFVIIQCLLINSCDKVVSVTTDDELLPTGKLFVDSSPSGSLIYLNGKFTGYLTPDTIEFLQEGTYQLLIKQQYFKDVTSTVVVNSDSLTMTFIDYKKISGVFGKLNIDSNPRGAEIILNDSSTNKFTPDIIEGILPGKYELRLRISGFWDSKSEVEIFSGTTKYPFLNLTDSLIWVNYSTANSGLISDYITHVAIENGIVKWAATNGNGLVRFDDQEWKIYSEENSPLPSNFVKYITIDTDNKKWIATTYGLAVYDDLNWTIYNTSNSGLPVNEINCIAIAPDGKKWIGTAGGGLLSFDGSTWNVYNTTNSNVGSNFIQTVAIDEEGNIWTGTYDKGIAKFNGDSWVRFNSFKTGFSNNAMNIAIDHSGIIWAAIGFVNDIPGGSAFYDGTGWTTNQLLPSDEVFYVTVDDQNNKWFANSYLGISKFDGNTWINYNTTNSRIPNDRIFSIAIDGAGNKWMATYGGGLSKYKGN